MSGEYTSPQASAAFTPGANSTLWLVYLRSDSLADPSVSGHGTWTKVTHHDLGQRLLLFRCSPGASPSSAAVSVSASSLSGYGRVFEISGDVDDTSPLVQSGSNAQTESDPATSMAVSMSAISDSNNLGVVVVASTDSGSTFAPQNSWNELFDDNISSPGASIACQYLEGSVDVDVLNSGVYRNTIAIGFEVAASGGLSATIGQVTETDTAQALSSDKSKEIGQVTETDTAQSMTVGSGITSIIGQVTETDTAQPLTPLQLSITSVSPTSPKAGDSVTINLSGVANASGKTATLAGKALTLTSQNSSSISLTWPDLHTFDDLSLRYNQSHALVVTDAGATATDNVTTQPADNRDWHAITALNGIYTDDTDLAIGDEHLGYYLNGAGSIATDGELTVTSGFATYRYWVYDISASAWAGPADEVVVQTIAQVTETDSALALSSNKTKGIGQVTETDTANPMGSATSMEIAQVSETDTVQPLSSEKTKTLNQASETDTAQPFVLEQGGEIGIAVETDSAHSFEPTKAKEIGQVSEISTALSLTPRMPPYLLSASVVETDLVMNFSEVVNFGAGGNGGFTVSGGATLAYSSGAGTTQLVYTITGSISDGDTLAYTQPTNGVQNTYPIDMVSFSGETIITGGSQRQLVQMGIGLGIGL